MNIGKLDRRISFERFTLMDDDLQSVETWAAHGSPIWAAKQDVSDGERVQAGGVSASLTSRFVVRSSEFTRNLTAKDRIVYRGVAYNIFGIKELGRNDWLEITAGAVVDG